MEWIHVNDRLPDIDESEYGAGSKVVLVVSKDGVECGYLTRYKRDGQMHWVTNDSTIQDEIHGVTHWMLLPEPPKRTRSLLLQDVTDIIKPEEGTLIEWAGSVYRFTNDYWEYTGLMYDIMDGQHGAYYLNNQPAKETITVKVRLPDGTPMEYEL